MAHTTIRRFVLGVLLAVTALLGACNTMEGLGEDTGAAGQALENSAERNKGY